MTQPHRRGPAITADFTSALILGLAHGSPPLSWQTLTTGSPAALRPSSAAERAARDFAALVGADDAVVMSSTLHAFSDLFGPIWPGRGVILHDEALYPIARWGIERAQLRGARVVSFKHLSASSLAAALERIPASDPPPAVWVVTDGFCAGCARPAPLRAYAASVRARGGRVIVDDAQAIGLYGRSPTVNAPYGHGGGGTLALAGLTGDPTLVVVASLAKAFGAPLALVAGARSFIGRLRSDGETLVHCSPPCEPVLAAAGRALAQSADGGDALRAGLACRVASLRRAFRRRGLPVRGGWFPMQRVPLPGATMALALHDRLIERGVRAVVRRSRCNDELSLTFIVTARHSDAQIQHAAAALAEAARDCSGKAPSIASSSSSTTCSSNLEV